MNDRTTSAFAGFPRGVRIEQAGRVYRFVAEQPSWVSRAAMTVFVLAILLPLLALALVAVALGTFAFLVLTGVARVVAFVRGLGGGLGSGDGRENVRVIVRREEA